MESGLAFCLVFPKQERQSVRCALEDWLAALALPFTDPSDIEDSVIFAELEYEGDYSAIHEELAGFVKANFSNVESGVQGDSWIWILDGEEKVAIDTFTSMKHQVKSSTKGAHVQKAIKVLKLKYTLKVFEVPEPEPHE